MNDLIATPLLWLAVTLVVFEAADILSRRSGRHPLCHPVLLATPVLIGVLLATRTPYPTYAEATQVLGFLLGPAVVGLAVPIWAQRATIRRLAKPLTCALLAGAVTAIVSAVGIVWMFGAPVEIMASIAPRATTTPVEIMASIAPRATTTPVGMAVAAQLGGIPSLAAVIVLMSGVIGAMTATPLLNLLKIKDYRARGFAVGVSAHGFGAARAFQVDQTAGAFASLGMALNAAATATILSIVASLI